MSEFVGDKQVVRACCCVGGREDGILVMVLVQLVVFSRNKDLFNFLLNL